MAHENTKVHTDGTTLVVESGGVIEIKAGGALNNSGTALNTPVASAAQAVVTQTQTTLTDSTGGTPSTTLAAETPFVPSVAWDGSSVFPSAADATAIGAINTAQRNAIASLAAELALVKADLANALVLLHAIRSAAITQSVIKGSA